MFSSSTFLLRVPISTNVCFLDFAAAFIPILLFASFAMYRYIKKKEQEAHSLWLIRQDELEFSTPPTILGRGSFGCVLQAEFRGSKVAIKRVITSNKSSPEKSALFDARSVGNSSNGVDLESGKTNLSSMAKDSTEDDDDDFTDESKDNGDQQPKQNEMVSSARAQDRRGSASSGRKWSISNQRSNFVEEMLTLSKLRHPNIITTMGKCFLSQSWALDRKC